MTPAEAIRRAENILANPHQMFTTTEIPKILAGLLEALNAKALEAK
jgi:hypothetical protein